jgi:hypothetical protein
MREAIAGILLTKMILRGASSRGWPGATRLLRPKHARPKVQKRFSKEKDEQCSPTREVHASRTSRRPRKLTSHCTVVLRVAGRGVGSAPVDATQAPTENRSFLSIPTKVFLISAYCSGLYPQCGPHSIFTCPNRDGERRILVGAAEECRRVELPQWQCRMIYLQRLLLQGAAHVRHAALCQRNRPELSGRR